MPSPPDSETRKKRDTAIRTLDEEIAQHLAQAYRTGEIQSAKGFGKPMAESDGWSETPVEFRLPFKILKNAGLRPPEIGIFQKRAALREQVAACTCEAERTALLAKLAEFDQLIALRLEGMRVNGKL